MGNITAQAATTTATQAAATAATTQVVFRDDFNTLDQVKWRINSAKNGSAEGYPGGPWHFGTDEEEVVTDDPTNVGVSGGSLYIKPQRDTVGKWTSARIETNQADFKPPPGGVMHVEARLQMPNVTGTQALGYWPAFWMLGSPYKTDRWSWPGIGEFDIMENVNGIGKNWSTMHCGIFDNSGPCNETDGIGNGGVAPSNGVAFQSAYHVFAFEWDRSQGEGREQFRWYNDGILVHTVRQDTPPALPGRAPVAPGVWAATWTSITQHFGYFIILNVAMGGQMPRNHTGGLTPATLPGVPMLVDYVLVEYTGGGTVPPTSTTPPTAPTSTSTPVATSTPVTTATATSQPTSTTAPPTTTVAGTPSNLRLSAQTASTATLSWNGPANGTYDILRGEAGDKIATVVGNSFTDQGLQKGPSYVYSVRGSGVTTPQLTVVLGTTPTTTTAPSTTTSTTTSTSTPPATTPTTPVGAPSGLKATATRNSVSLTWVGSASTTYDILRGEDGVKIASVKGNTFIDGGLSPSTLYVYSVRDSAGTTPQISRVTLP